MVDSHNRRWLALFAMVPAALVVGIDATVLSLALPTLATDLHASTSELQWFVSAYMLVFAAAMLPAGLLADRYGRKRILLLALVVLAVGSLACAYSATSAQFMAARVLLALGAAMVVPAALGALPVLFTEEERPKAVAAIMAATMLGQPIGPLLGGWLLTTFWWGSVFIINVPVVLVALVAVAAFVPESRSERRPRFDLPGIALSSAGLALLIYGVIQAGENGWGDATAIAALLSRRRHPRRVRALGAPRPRPARRPPPLPLARLHLGDSAHDPGLVLDDGPACSRCRCTSKRCSGWTPSATACGSCR